MLLTKTILIATRQGIENHIKEKERKETLLVQPYFSDLELHLGYIVLLSTGNRS